MYYSPTRAMQFRCRLASADGEILEGIYTGENEAELRQSLEGKGYHVLSLRKRAGFNWSALAFPKRRRVSDRAFIVFNQELAALLHSGMPLVQSLEILKERVEEPALGEALGLVHQRVRAGTSLAEAFEECGGLFPGVYVASIVAGEKSGALEDVLRRYVKYAKVVSSLKRRTVSALVYPGILLALSLCVVAIIVLRVVPEFASFYEGMGASLPIATQLLLGFSYLLLEYFLVLVIVVAVAIIVTVQWWARPGSAGWVDRQVLRMPFVGGVALKFATSQMSRLLATLLGGGIPLVNSLDIASRSIGNRHIAIRLENVARQVREGEALSVSMRSCSVFPSVAIKMVEVGESTGALQHMLGNIADFLDEEIDTALSRVMALVEPLLLVVMGLVIAALLISLYWPLLQLGAIAS